LIAWGPAVLWAAVLFFLSELQEVPPELDRWADVNDKVVHFSLYFVLGAALAWAKVRGSVEWPHGVFLLIGYVYGALDEWHQSFVPGRTPDLFDFFADVAGVTVGYLAILGIRALWSRANPPPLTESRQET
jgi:VanZ family protein